MRLLRTSALFLTLGLASCGGGSSGSSAVAPGGQTQVANGVKGTLVVTLSPRYDAASAKTRTPQFASPSASSLGWSVNSGTMTFADVSATSGACTTANNARTCSIPISAPGGNDSFSISLFDQASGAGNLLGTGSNSTNVTASGFSVTVGINPIVAGILGMTVTFAGGAHTLPVGQPTTATVLFTFTDPDGQAIPPVTSTPNFASSITLTSSDPHITFSPSTLTTPGQTTTLSYDGSTSVQQSPDVTVAQGSKTIGTLSINGGPPSICSMTSTLPGTYLSFFGSGTFSGSTFTLTPSGSFWSKSQYVATAPMPAPTSSPGPTPTSSPFSYTFYLGTYAYTNTVGTVTTSTGCFYLGQYTSGGTTSTFAVGFPYFGSASYTISITPLPPSGTISSLTITNISATGGSGTFALSTGETGTLTLTQEFQFSQAQARQILGTGTAAIPAGRLPF